MRARYRTGLQRALDAQEDALIRATRQGLVESFHPGYERICAKKKFRKWLDMQPLVLRELAESEFAADAILLLDLYRGRRGK